MALVMSISVSAFAATITIKQNNTDGTAGAETYVAYKIFDVTKTSDVTEDVTTDSTLGAGSAEGFSYSIDAGSAWLSVVQASGFFTLTASADGTVYNVQLADDSYNSADGAKQIASYLLANAPATITDPDVKYTLTSDGDEATATVDDGYYLITSSLGTNLVLATSNITINTKNEYVTDEKTVEKASVTVGENATYYVKVVLPATIDQTKAVTVHDELDEHLKFNEDVQAVGVKTSAVTGDPKDQAYAAIGTSYTVKTTGLTDDCTFEIEIPATTVASLMDANKTVTGEGADAVTTYNSVTVFFKYTAELLSTAVADTGYINKEFSTYSEYTTEPSNPEVKTYDFNFTKVDGDAAKLDGAKFELYDVDPATVTTVYYTDDTYETVSTTETEYSKPSAEPLALLANGANYKKADTDDTGTVTEIVVNSKTNNAATVISGLGGADNTTGTNYYLLETEAPSGFNKLTAPIVVNVKDNGTITVSLNGETLASANDAFNVVNQSGTVLPSTGGIGTTIFYVVGSILVVAVGVLLITKKRMSREG